MITRNINGDVPSHSSHSAHRTPSSRPQSRYIAARPPSSKPSSPNEADNWTSVKLPIAMVVPASRKSNSPHHTLPINHRKFHTITLPPPRGPIPESMVRHNENVPTFLRSGRRSQLRRQHRNVRAGALVFDQDALEVVELVLADLRIGGQNLLSRG